jgi:hypothetical protein
MDFSIKGPGAGLRFSRQRLSERRRQKPDAPAPAGGAPEDAAFFAHDLGEAEQMRASVVAVNQAIEASEVALAWAHSAAEGLEEALAHAGMMDKTGQEALGARQGPPEPAAWKALQERWAKHCRAIDAVSDRTRFGPFQLLDGTLGCRAAAFGPGLSLISVGDDVRSSPPEGYEIVISQEPTRATLLAGVPLTQAGIDGGLRLAIVCAGKRADVETRAGQSPESVASALHTQAQAGGLPVSVRLGPKDRLLVQHHRLGSRYRFTAESSIPDVLSNPDGSPRAVANGRDVAGLLHGEPGTGAGQLLTGHPDNRVTAGLCVRFHPTADSTAPGWKNQQLAAGRVIVSQQRLRLRWEGPEAVDIALRLDPVRCGELGRAEDDDGDPVCLADVTDLPPERARSAVLAIGIACRTLAAMAARVRAASDVALPRHLARLRVQAQNLAAASQAITTPHLAMDAVRALVGGLRRSGSDAAAAQNAMPPTALLRLLEGEPAAEDRTKLN